MALRLPLSLDPRLILTRIRGSRGASSGSGCGPWDSVFQVEGQISEQAVWDSLSQRLRASGTHLDVAHQHQRTWHAHSDTASLPGRLVWDATPGDPPLRLFSRLSCSCRMGVHHRHTDRFLWLSRS